MAEKESSESLSAKSNKVFKFKWTNSMIEDLLNAIKEYKSVMEFNCSDFNADKPRLYEEDCLATYMNQCILDQMLI